MLSRGGMIRATGLNLRLPAVLRCLGTLTKAESKKKRNELFDQEKKRQRAAVGRIDKIEVRYSGPSENVTLMMNKGISTPYDCTKHISEAVKSAAALAEVNGSPWDMHRPLSADCDIKFLGTSAPDTHAVNKAFWRTCSLMLGSVAEKAFKEGISIHLHSFPAPNIRSGSFIHDVSLGFEDWEPTSAELRALSALFVQLSRSAVPTERLVVGETVALDMFRDNPYKSSQIPAIAKNNNECVVLYRIGDHVDISKGPMIANTDLVGRCTVAAVHKISADQFGTLYRFQGIALPAGILVNHFAYGILEERAKKLNNCVWVPNKMVEDSEDHIAAAVN